MPTGESPWAMDTDDIAGAMARPPELAGALSPKCAHGVETHGKRETSSERMRKNMKIQIHIAQLMLVPNMG